MSHKGEDAGYRVEIRNMVLDAQIGVHAHEEGRTQRVRVTVEVKATPWVADTPDSIDQALDYAAIAKLIRETVSGGHIRLIETLADRIARGCLVLPKARSARVTVEKLDVYRDAESVSVTLERKRRDERHGHHDRHHDDHE